MIMSALFRLLNLEDLRGTHLRAARASGEHEPCDPILPDRQQQKVVVSPSISSTARRARTLSETPWTRHLD